MSGEHEEICPQDIYALNYYGIIVVFEVCDVHHEKEDYVSLIELETKRYKDGIALTKQLKPAKYPLVIKNNNVWSKTTYYVRARLDKKLPIVVSQTSRLFWEATKYVDSPMIGTFLAEPFPNYLTTYWEKPKKIKKDIDKLKLIN